MALHVLVAQSVLAMKSAMLPLLGFHDLQDKLQKTCIAYR